MRIFVRSNRHPELLFDSVTVVERVPDFVLLPDGVSYVKVGGTCSHHGPRDDNANANCQTTDNNHWGTSRLVGIIVAVADSFAAKYPNHRLRINDMSLPNGGKFEIDGSWSVNADHQEHRSGGNADVSLDAYKDGDRISLDSRQRRRLWDLILDLAGRRAGDETSRNHYHIN
jgi:murein endopeptidase